MTATLAPSLLWLALGLSGGIAYWLTLRWSVGMLVSGRSVALPVALQLLRFATVGGALTCVAMRWGWPALLLSASGLALARLVVVRGTGGA